MAVYSDLNDEKSKIGDMKNNFVALGILPVVNRDVVPSQRLLVKKERYQSMYCVACLQKLESSLQMKQQDDRTVNNDAERLGMSDESSE
jgi:hypothetical protein